MFTVNIIFFLIFSLPYDNMLIKQRNLYYRIYRVCSINYNFLNYVKNISFIFIRLTFVLIKYYKDSEINQLTELASGSISYHCLWVKYKRDEVLGLTRGQTWSRLSHINTNYETRWVRERLLPRWNARIKGSRLSRAILTRALPERSFSAISHW